MVRRTFRFMLRALRPHARVVALGIACIFLEVQAVSYVPNAVRATIDLVSGASPATVPFLFFGRLATPGDALALGLLVIVGAALIAGVFTFLRRWLLIRTSRQIEYELRKAYFAHLERLSFRNYAGLRTGDLMARATADIEGMRMLVGPAIMHFLFTALLTPTIILYMVEISGRLTVLALAPMIVVVVLVRFISAKQYRLSHQAQAKLADLSNRAQENFAGIKVVKAFTQEQAEATRFATLAAEYRGINMRYALLRGVFQGAIWALANLGTLIFVLFSPTEVAAGGIAPGEAIAFFAYQQMIFWPMIAFGWTATLFQRGAASLARYEQVMAIAPDIVTPAAPVVPDAVRGAISFENVSYRHDPEVPVLDGVTLSIAAGQTVAFVGPVGAGKTTLVSLIPRLFDPDQGVVRLDGHDLRTLELGWLRRAIGFVPQDSFLFSATLADNIAYSEEDPVDRARIQRVAERAGLAPDVAQFARGYDQVIGERGVTLSGGQKQRMSLARALLHDPSILILDDAFSAVDTSTEDRILTELRAALLGRTTLLISHRVSTVKNADWIYVLQAGRVTEQGTDEDLMALGGFYAELAAKQRLTAEIDAL